MAVKREELILNIEEIEESMNRINEEQQQLFLIEQRWAQDRFARNEDRLERLGRVSRRLKRKLATFKW